MRYSTESRDMNRFLSFDKNIGKNISGNGSKLRLIYI